MKTKDGYVVKPGDWLYAPLKITLCGEPIWAAVPVRVARTFVPTVKLAAVSRNPELTVKLDECCVTYAACLRMAGPL